MRAELIPAGALAGRNVSDLHGAVLLAPAAVNGTRVAKGARLDEALALALVSAARSGGLTEPLRLGWPEQGDLHEDEAALRLARAVAGPELQVGAPRQSRVDLIAKRDGVLRVRIEALGRINRIDPLEVFTLFHGQAVREGQVVAAVKVAPHIVPEASVVAGEAVAETERPVVDVAPYLPLEVAAIAAENLPDAALARFEQAARAKIEGLGGRFLGVEAPGSTTATRLGAVLRDLALEREVALILVGGVSAGDPLSPFYAALDSLGGTLRRRGVPAHPGSMIWLAELGATTILGLPQCGMFSMATAADLVLPRLLTGERVTPDTLADLGHGGLLGPEMRFRFPEYARDLESPE